VKYQLSEDTLNFEDLFRSMQKRMVTIGEYEIPLFRIICRKGTVDYYSDDLIHRLHCLDYYRKIKERIYPDAEIYQPDLTMTEN